jgi:3-methyladenine DNA glycosylase/8-oxoguanine DNA glycosylase
LGLSPGLVWRTTRTEAGPATLHYTRSAGQVVVCAWGPGARIELDRVPQVLGEADDPTGFAADADPVMARAYRRFGPGWRVVRTGRVLEALVPAVLEQRVTGLEATRAWSRLVRAHGEPAPGPAGSWHPDAPHRGAAPQRGPTPTLMVAPDARSWAAIPSWAWHRAGVDPGRRATITAAVRRASTLEALSDRSPQDAAQAIATLLGIGTWTAAEVAVRAWGARDAVSFGDFHLARAVVHTLTGRPDGTDAELAELLTPWIGQRARAVRVLLLHGGHRPPRRAPRSTITDHRRW